MEGARYLGDGLYASFDGYMITLRAPRADGDHWVGLEPDVAKELLKFMACYFDATSMLKAITEVTDGRARKSD